MVVLKGGEERTDYRGLGGVTDRSGSAEDQLSMGKANLSFR